MVKGWEHFAMQGTNSSTSRRVLPDPFASKFFKGMQEEVKQSTNKPTVQELNMDDEMGFVYMVEGFTCHIRGHAINGDI